MKIKLARQLAWTVGWQLVEKKEGGARLYTTHVFREGEVMDALI